MNLESLRRKRANRTGVKTVEHNGRKRISLILERGTRKFHGDIGLWMQYLEYSRKQKAYKRVGQIVTSLLRLHPTKPELWIYAAKYVVDDQGDMTAARNYMQKGLRFCKQSRELWLEYGRLELIYMAKISARRNILGLNRRPTKTNITTTAENHDADHISLPAITAEDMDPSLSAGGRVDPDALQNLDATPALSGAIPIAIFDAGMENFNDVSWGERFFVMTAEFKSLNCLNKITKHIADVLTILEPLSPVAISCSLRQPLVGIKPETPDFPATLGSVLKEVRTSFATKPSLDLHESVMKWLSPYLRLSNLDPDIRAAISATIGRIMTDYKVAVQTQGGSSGDRLADLVERFQQVGLDTLVLSTLKWSLELWPSYSRLAAIEKSAMDGTIEIQ